ncbi:diguanylate cyclase [Desulfosporosinus sp.]|uniref:diguanylate cyclase n=1 Tax=Desulfosporosinus sp. TaxID=157907 RepID=UPI0025C37DCB|nr:diguanylate cyclase [Desulfosporosinus sp.]MBC2727099.1 diguanylate cyclase [Desulfosporosinus sp.]
MEFARDMFFNATILVSFITLGNHLFRDKCATPSSPMHRKILVGILSGILGCLLMVFSVQVTPQIYVDFRNIPIIMMALYTTFPSAVVTSLVIGIFRIAYFGITQSSITAFTAAIIIGMGCGFVGRMNIKTPAKWVLSVLIVYIVAGTAFTILVKNSLLLRDILTVYCIGIAVASLLMYFLLENVTKANTLYSQMKDAAQKDYLTGLNNVRQFDELINITINRAKLLNQSLSILFIDIDFFKKVNDTFGHFEGDLVLKELGNILRNTCRSIDIISRNGGEEFSVILTDCPLAQAIEVADRIREAVEQHPFILSTGRKINISVSIGVSSYPEHTVDPEKLVEQADIALYNAKRAGRNLVSL